MGAAAAGLVAKAGGAEAVLGKEAMSLFGKDTAGAGKIAEFAVQNDISPEQINGVYQQLFGQPGGHPPEHYNDPIAAFENLLKKLVQQTAKAVVAAEPKAEKAPKQHSHKSPQVKNKKPKKSPFEIPTLKPKGSE